MVARNARYKSALVLQQPYPRIRKLNELFFFVGINMTRTVEMIDSWFCQYQAFRQIDLNTIDILAIDTINKLFFSFKPADKPAKDVLL